MKKSILLIVTCMVSLSLQASPEGDLQAYQRYFKNRLPNLSFEDMSNGMYNFSEDKRNQWLEIMEFPPYEMVLDEGKSILETPFANGKNYADCLDKGGIGIAHTYPRFDKKAGKVVTLIDAVNQCRTANGEKALKHNDSGMLALLSYLADTSRGKKIDVDVPNDPKALAAYEDGKRIYFTRRGTRDFGCYHCHWEASGMRIRGNELSPAIGQATHFPTYRSKWGSMGTIQRRYKGCMNNIGAVDIGIGSEAMNNLEYFHTYMSNGIPMNAPGTRF